MLKWLKKLLKTNDEVGDGTTTATVLAQAIREGCKYVSAGMNPMVKRGIDTAIEKVIEEVKKNSKKLKRMKR